MSSNYVPLTEDERFNHEKMKGVKVKKDVGVFS